MSPRIRSLLAVICALTMLALIAGASGCGEKDDQITTATDTSSSASSSTSSAGGDESGNKPYDINGELWFTLTRADKEKAAQAYIDDFHDDCVEISLPGLVKAVDTAYDVQFDTNTAVSEPMKQACAAAAGTGQP